MGPTPANTMVPGVGFEPTSPRLQRGAITRSASQAVVSGAAGGNRTRVCALAPRGSAIELRTLQLARIWCTEQDSNLRNPKAPDLQSGLVAA